MILALPNRRQFASREEFAGAVQDAFGELYAAYETEPVLEVIPDWAQRAKVNSVALPIKVAREGNAVHGVSSIVKNAIEMEMREITRICRVEMAGKWFVFFEGK